MKSTKVQRPREEREPHILKVIRGEAPSLLSFAETDTEEPDSTLEPDEWDLGKAFLRATAPRKIKELEAEVSHLKRAMRGRLIGGKNKVGLKFYIRAAKLAAVKSGNLNYSQSDIATSVDRMLADRKTNFSKVCPESWQKYNPPRLFADVFSLPKHPLLKLAKPYISKTEV